MSLMPQSRLCAAAATAILLHTWIVATAEKVRFSLVSREGVEARLRKYTGDNKQREATLKQMFTEAGCDGQHISEQPVKGSKLPNVICLLPGSSDRVIIVGAHFDRVSAGDGVVDNWSGASLLPSLYEAVKTEPRKHTYIFIGFTDEERGEVGVALLRSTNGQGTGCCDRGDGQHGHARSGAYRGLATSGWLLLSL